jgi:hypothetical protein
MSDFMDERPSDHIPFVWRLIGRSNFGKVFMTFLWADAAG